MTDRYNAFIVILERDIRDDDAQPVLNALRQIKGVLRVKPHIAGFEESIAYERVRQELIEKLWEVLK